MKMMIIAAFTALSLVVGVANAETVNQTAPQQSGTQYNWTVGGAGWG